MMWKTHCLCDWLRVELSVSSFCSRTEWRVIDRQSNYLSNIHVNLVRKQMGLCQRDRCWICICKWFKYDSTRGKCVEMWFALNENGKNDFIVNWFLFRASDDITRHTVVSFAFCSCLFKMLCCVYNANIH